MKEHLNLENIPPQKEEYGRLKSYGLGFLWSVILTLAAYLFVALKLFSGWALDLSVAIFAIAQACVQLILFLHLGQESKPRWNLMIFLFMALVVVILVFGSIWIMHNLNYNLMVQSP